MAKSNIQQAGYSDQSIKTLKGADRVRKRPAVIFGSDGIEGCEHSFFEILSNSIDEAREGYGDEINVTVYRDKSIEVEDFGRGIPLDYNEKEQRYNWDLVFCELYAGGKYSKGEDDAYEFSLGLNGLGACATQYSSEYMDVTVYKPGTKYGISFKKGNPVCELQKEDYKGKRTGTVIKWRPDLEVFSDINIGLDYFTSVMRKQAVVNAGLTLNLKYQNDDGSFYEESYRYENGIKDYVDEFIGEEYISPAFLWSGERVGKDREDKPEYKVKMQMCIAFSNKANMLEYYHNSSYLEYGGSPEKATRSALVWAFDNYLRNNNKYTKNESKLNFQDVEDCLVLVINSFSTQTSYENQTKKAITNSFIQEAMNEFLRAQMQAFFAENPELAEKVSAQVLINKRSRESAESARIGMKTKLIQKLDISNRVEKFVGCRSKDPSKRELYIVEGDSALTSVKLARNAEFQAVIPVRGKTINCIKNSYERIFKSDIIVDLLKVIGCGVEIKSKSNKEISGFDYDLLKWDKIIICTDADEDGYQIRTLILTMFYRLLPTLIKRGKVYIAESPLFEIRVKDKSYFAYTEAEKDDILAELGDVKVNVQRSKGLGENEPEMMSLTTMNPATRRLIQILPDDEQKTYEMFDILLGDNLEGRKQYIVEKGSMYVNYADV